MWLLIFSVFTLTVNSKYSVGRKIAHKKTNIIFATTFGRTLWLTLQVSDLIL